jgi:hypothetical protein
MYLVIIEIYEVFYKTRWNLSSEPVGISIGFIGTYYRTVWGKPFGLSIVMGK